MCSFLFCFRYVCPCSVPVLLPSPLLLHSLLSHAFLLYSVLPFSPSFILTWCGHAVVVASLKVKRKRQSQTRIKKEDANCDKKNAQSAKRHTNMLEQRKPNQMREHKTLQSLIKKARQPQKNGLQATKPRSREAETLRGDVKTWTQHCYRRMLTPRYWRVPPKAASAPFACEIQTNLRIRVLQSTAPIQLSRAEMRSNSANAALCRERKCCRVMTSMVRCSTVGEFPLQLYVAKFQLIQPLGCMFNLTILRMLRLN